MYTGTELSKMTNVNGQEFWYMFSDKYCIVTVTKVGPVLEKRSLRLTPKCVNPLSFCYCP